MASNVGGRTSLSSGFTARPISKGGPKTSHRFGGPKQTSPRSSMFESRLRKKKGPRYGLSLSPEQLKEIAVRRIYG